MKRYGMGLALIQLAIAFSLSMVACGLPTAGGVATVTITTCASPAASSSAPLALIRPAGASVRLRPVTTLPPGLTPGEVRVVVESGQYGPCDTIYVWAGNGLGQSIYTADHQSDCTIVTLQRQMAGGWQPVAQCQLAIATRTVEIPPVQSDFVQFLPGTAGGQSSAWPVGTYRVAFSYYLGATATTMNTVVYSPTFIIG
jgi:hypothetical protein